MITGIPVSEVLRKSDDPMDQPNLALIQGVRAHEDEGSIWALEQVAKRLRKLFPEIQIADIHLGSYKILSGVSNDPDDTLFSPNDQFPLVKDLIDRSDIIVWATREKLGFPDANTVRVLERYADLIIQAKKEGLEKPLLKNRPVCAIVHGKCGAYHAGVSLAGAFNKLGLTVVRHGIACWDEGRGDILKDKGFASNLDSMAEEIAKLLKVRS
jgi:hypothetical protein